MSSEGINTYFKNVFSTVGKIFIGFILIILCLVILGKHANADLLSDQLQAIKDKNISITSPLHLHGIRDIFPEAFKEIEKTVTTPKNKLLEAFIPYEDTKRLVAGLSPFLEELVTLQTLKDDKNLLLSETQFQRIASEFRYEYGQKGIKILETSSNTQGSQVLSEYYQVPLHTEAKTVNNLGIFIDEYDAIGFVGIVTTRVKTKGIQGTYEQERKQLISTTLLRLKNKIVYLVASKDFRDINDVGSFEYHIENFVSSLIKANGIPMPEFVALPSPLDRYYNTNSNDASFHLLARANQDYEKRPWDRITDKGEEAFFATLGLVFIASIIKLLIFLVRKKEENKKDKCEAKINIIDANLDGVENIKKDDDFWLCLPEWLRWILCFPIIIFVPGFFVMLFTYVRGDNIFSLESFLVQRIFAPILQAFLTFFFVYYLMPRWKNIWLSMWLYIYILLGLITYAIVIYMAVYQNISVKEMWNNETIFDLLQATVALMSSVYFYFKFKQKLNKLN
jgi:hypothetical protein